MHKSLLFAISLDQSELLGDSFSFNVLLSADAILPAVAELSQIPDLLADQPPEAMVEPVRPLSNVHLIDLVLSHHAILVYHRVEKLVGVRYRLECTHVLSLEANAFSIVLSFLEVPFIILVMAGVNPKAFVQPALELPSVMLILAPAFEVIIPVVAFIEDAAILIVLNAVAILPAVCIHPFEEHLPLIILDGGVAVGCPFSEALNNVAFVVDYVVGLGLQGCRFLL